MRTRSRIMIYLFLSLSLYGFVFQLMKEPMRLVYDTLFLVIAVLIFWAIYVYFLRPKRPKIRFSKTQYMSNPVKPERTVAPKDGKKEAKSQSLAAYNRRKTASKSHPFTVIEGNKGKKKKPSSS